MKSRGGIETENRKMKNFIVLAGIITDVNTEVKP